jgi:ACS family 4-hydroxyphenylacetate permease-like MFS transporter
MITWGLASAACMFAAGATSLYVLRLLVGVAEAGFLPGLLLYLTFWFPPTYRARATALLMIAQPVSMAIGSPLSGLILDHTQGLMGFGGWRWLFLIEGLPAFILGFVTLFYLSDGPTQAKWLTDEERATLQCRLEREKVTDAPTRSRKLTREVLNRNTSILGIIYFCFGVALTTNSLWTPQIVREVLKAHSFSYVGLFTAIPAICALIATPLWGAHSDKKMERAWHVVLPLALAALGWIVVAVVKAPELRMLGLIFCFVGVLAGQAIFWTVPPKLLSPAARPVGIAAINCCASIGSALSPLVVGLLRDLTHGWVASLLFVAAVLAGAAFLIFLIPTKENVALPAASTTGS